MDAAQQDLRSAVTRVDAAQEDVRAAQGRVDTAVAEEAKLARSGRTFLLRGSSAKPEVEKRVAELTAEFAAKQVARQQMEAALAESKRALVDAQAQFEAARPALEEAVRRTTEQVNRVLAARDAAQTALDQLTGVRAVDFFRRKLQAAMFTSEDVELVLQHRAHNDAPETKASRQTETSLQGRRFTHFVPRRIEDWADFEADKETWLTNVVGNRVVNRPEEPFIIHTLFNSEREFGNYWQNPRQATTGVLSQLFPDRFAEGKTLFSSMERGRRTRTS